MDLKENDRIKCVLIIQRCVRKFLKKRSYLSNQNTNIKKEHNLDLVNLNSNALQKNSVNNNITRQAEYIDDMKKQIHEIYTGLNTFYGKLANRAERAQHIRNVLENMDRTIENLQKISKLDDCVTITAINVSQDACFKHEKALNNLSIKWWQNLDAYN